MFDTPILTSLYLLAFGASVLYNGWSGVIGWIIGYWFVVLIKKIAEMG